jgi:uncharacterized protein YcbK (DUF882 family)
MIIKQGVVIAGLQPVMQQALDWAEECYEEFKYPLVITSAIRDEAYNASIGGNINSKHISGLAVDLRIYPNIDHNYRIHAKIKKGLDDLGFQTILESNHIHIEYDPK